MKLSLLFLLTVISSCSIIRINSKYDDFDFYDRNYINSYIAEFDGNIYYSKFHKNEKKYQEIEAKDIQPFFAQRSLTWVYSWGPHCPPCVAKLPVYDSIASIYETKANIHFLSISYEYDIFFMNNAYQRYRLSHRTYLLKNTVRGKMKMADKIQQFENELCPNVFPYNHGFPTHYIFDINGKLVWSKIGAIPGSEIVHVLDSLAG